MGDLQIEGYNYSRSYNVLWVSFPLALDVIFALRPEMADRANWVGEAGKTDIFTRSRPRLIVSLRAQASYCLLYFFS